MEDQEARPATTGPMGNENFPSPSPSPAKSPLPSSMEKLSLSSKEHEHTATQTTPTPTPTTFDTPGDGAAAGAVGGNDVAAPTESSPVTGDAAAAAADAPKEEEKKKEIVRYSLKKHELWKVGMGKRLPKGGDSKSMWNLPWGTIVDGQLWFSIQKKNEKIRKGDDSFKTKSITAILNIFEDDWKALTEQEQADWHEKVKPKGPLFTFERERQNYSRPHPGHVWTPIPPPIQISERAMPPPPSGIDYSFPYHLFGPGRENSDNRAKLNEHRENSLGVDKPGDWGWWIPRDTEEQAKQREEEKRLRNLPENYQQPTFGPTCIAGYWNNFKPVTPQPRGPIPKDFI